MSQDQEPQILDILESARQQPESRRCEFVRRACGSDARLMQEVFLRLQGLADLPAIVAAPEPECDPPTDRLAPGSAPSAAKPGMTGPMPETLGGYRIEGMIGRGGMGIVYKAREPKLCRDVAIKTILPGIRLDPAAVARFDQEMQVIGQLDHVNVVRALHTLEVEGVSCLVMEYIDGETLEKIVRRRGKIPPREACEYICQAALGLEHAYQKGIVHRDVKPSNFLVSTAGVVKLLDLGIARLREGLEQDQPSNSQELAIGTADFIAPEQQACMLDADTRSDIYSLGCTFYYCLTGRAPFGDHKTLQAKIAAHRAETPRPVADFGVELEPEILAILARMMAKTPGERYPTPAAVAEAIVQALERIDGIIACAAVGDHGVDAGTQHLPSESALPARAEAGGAASVPSDTPCLGREDEPPTNEDPMNEVSPRTARRARYLSSRNIGIAMLLAAAALVGVRYSRSNPVSPKPTIITPHAADAQGGAIRAPDGRRTRIGLCDAQQLIGQHLESLDPKVAEHRRFFSLTHLSNDSRVRCSELEECRRALHETIAQFLPEGSAPPHLAAVDEQGTILALDMKLLHLEKMPGWQRLVASYPYGLTYEDGADAALADADLRIRTKLIGEPVPCIRADWFIANCVTLWDRSGARSIPQDSLMRTVLKRYMADMDIACVACELDLLNPATGEADTAGLSRRISENPRWRDELKLGVLCSGQKIARADWTAVGGACSTFQEVARDLGRGLPVVPQAPVAALRR